MLCPYIYCANVLSPAVDLIPRPSFTPLWESNVVRLFLVSNGRKFVLCLHHWNYRDLLNNNHNSQLHKCRMSTWGDIQIFYLCDLLGNRFFWTQHLVLSIIVWCLCGTQSTLGKNYLRFNTARVKDVELLTSLSLFNDMTPFNRLNFITFLSEQLWPEISWMDLSEQGECPNRAASACPAGSDVLFILTNNSGVTSRDVRKTELRFGYGF